MLYADFSVYTLIVIMSALLHETGHLVFMKIFGVRIYSVTVFPFGAVIRSDAASLPYKREATVAFAGAGVNIVCAAVSGIAYMCVPGIALQFICVCNLFLALINLVPVKTLDGGRILFSLLCCRMLPEKAQEYSDFISYLSFIFLVIASLALLTVTGYNFSLVIFSLCIFICTYVHRT